MFFVSITVLAIATPANDPIAESSTNMGIRGKILTLFYGMIRGKRTFMRPPILFKAVFAARNATREDLRISSFLQVIFMKYINEINIVK